MNARNLTDFSVRCALLEASHVTVEINRKGLLKSACARFAAGQVTAILGPNGAGKSTLMSVLTGQRQASSGEVHLAGQPLARYAQANLARLRACVAQETQVAFDFSVREVVELGRYPHRRQPSPRESTIADQAMLATAVAHLQDRALNTLSGGEKARVHLARALAQIWEPVAGGVEAAAARWLLLDEPTAALDLQHQHRMLQLAQSRAHDEGVGVVAVLHDLNLALRYSDHCVVLLGGEVFASGASAEVLTPACIRQVWDVVARPVWGDAPASGRQRRLQYVFEPAPLAVQAPTGC